MVKQTNKRNVMKKHKPSKKSGRASNSTPLKRNTSVITRKPVQRMTKDGINVSHREYVGPLMSSATPTAFSIDKSFKLNPGYTTVFPWLAHVARNYESYKFKKCVIVVQNYMSAMRDGMINYCVDYDAGDAAPGDLQQMLSNKTAGSRPVGAPFNIVLDVAALNKIGKNKFVRALDTDIFDTLLYDSGNLYFNASLPSDLNGRIVANIFIEYDVELKTPQVKSGASTVQGGKPVSAKLAKVPTDAQPINVKDGVGVKVGELLRDMALNITQGYSGGDLVNYAATVTGGLGQNINLPNLVNLASTVMGFADVSEPLGAEASAYFDTSEFEFFKTGEYVIEITLQQQTLGTSGTGNLFIDNVEMTTNAAQAAAEVLFASPVTVAGIIYYQRVKYIISVDVEEGDTFQVKQGCVIRTDGPEFTTMYYNRVGLTITPCTPEDFNYELRFRNEFPTITGLRGHKGLAFNGNDIHGLHSQFKTLDNHKFMAFDTSTPTMLGKYRRLDEDHFVPPTPNTNQGFVFHNPFSPVSRK
jgi:hypothetical protein